MNKESTIKMIAELSNAKGVSGFEDQVIDIIRGYSESLGITKEDSLRNYYIYRKDNSGKRPIVQLDAHSDEVGFMVQAIRPNGTLQIIPLGAWVTHNITAQKVWVRNGVGVYIPGIVASKPPHYMSEKEKSMAVEMRQITVDVGATSKEEAVNVFKMRIGEPIVPYVAFEYNEQHDLMIGKGFDNRLGCASIIDTLRELSEEKLKVDVVAAFASQEEVGTRGAVVTSRVIQPDIAIAFEGCPADDTFVDSFEVQTVLKKGPMLRHIDAKMITNPRFQRYALDMAGRHNIAVQEAVRAIGATNGAAIHLANRGVPTIVIGVPVRYAHTHYGISTYYDYEQSIKLACEILRSIDEDIIKSF